MILIMIEKLFSQRKINDFMGMSLDKLFPVPPLGNLLTYGQNGDKYLSQRKTRKSPLFPYQMTSEDSTSFNPPPPLNSPV